MSNLEGTIAYVTKLDVQNITETHKTSGAHPLCVNVIQQFHIADSLPAGHSDKCNAAVDLVTDTVPVPPMLQLSVACSLSNQQKRCKIMGIVHHSKGMPARKQIHVTASHPSCRNL